MLLTDRHHVITQMHFRQILGRILRFTHSEDQSAVLFMPAEPKLVEYAYRVGEDVPSEAGIVKIEKISSLFKIKQKKLEEQHNDNIDETLNFSLTSILKVDQKAFVENDSYSKSPLTSAYEKTVNIFGRFKQESLDIDIFNELEIY